MASVDELQNAEEAVHQMQEEQERVEAERLQAELDRAPVRATAQLERRFEEIPLDQISTMTNMRAGALPALHELALSIQENGLLQPPTVREVDDDERPYQLVFGRRRFEALRLINSRDLKTEVRFEVLSGLSNVEAMNMMAVENLQREDPEPIQFGRMMRLILAEDEDLKASDIARSWGITPAKASSFLKLLELPEAVQELVERGDLSFTSADMLRRAVSTGKIDEETAEALAEQAASGEIGATDLKHEAGYVPPAPENYEEWLANDQAARQAALGERVQDEEWEESVEYEEFDDDSQPTPVDEQGTGHSLAAGGGTNLPQPVRAARESRAERDRRAAEFKDHLEGLEALDEEASDEQLDAFLLGWLLLKHAPEEYLEAFGIRHDATWEWAWELEPDERQRRLRDLSLILLSDDPAPPAPIF